MANICPPILPLFFSLSLLIQRSIGRASLLPVPFGIRYPARLHVERDKEGKEATVFPISSFLSYMRLYFYTITTTFVRNIYCQRRFHGYINYTELPMHSLESLMKDRKKKVCELFLSFFFFLLFLPPIKMMMSNQLVSYLAIAALIFHFLKLIILLLLLLSRSCFFYSVPW